MSTGPGHLKELREIIYTEVNKSNSQGLAYAEAAGFSILDRKQLQFRTGAIDKEQINNLLVMTPHFYRATKEGRVAAGNLENRRKEIC